MLVRLQVPDSPTDCVQSSCTDQPLDTITSHRRRDVEGTARPQGRPVMVRRRTTDSVRVVGGPWTVLHGDDDEGLVEGRTLSVSGRHRRPVSASSSNTSSDRGFLKRSQLERASPE